MRDNVPRDLLVWLPVGAIPYANGMLRLTTYQATLGEPAASIVSTTLDVLGIAVWAWYAGRHWPAPSLRRGLVWLAATTTMHFVGNTFLFGMSQAQLAAKYRIQDGELWSVVSLWVLIAPWLFRAKASR
jgi:hypothetical protein